jgi:hypothetical protein
MDTNSAMEIRGMIANGAIPAAPRALVSSLKGLGAQHGHAPTAYAVGKSISPLRGLRDI